MTRTSGALFGLLALFVFCFTPSLAPASEAPNPPIPRFAVPDAAAQRNARKQINDIFGKDIARAKKPAEKSAIAKQLLQAGIDAKNDPSGKYEMLSMARDLAVAGGDAITALAAITELDQYAVDAMKLKADAMGAILRSTSNPQDALSIAAAIGPLVDEALRNEHYAAAKQLAELSVSTARAAKDNDALAQANARLEEVRESAAASVAAAKAALTLSTKPNDPAASLALGRFEAFIKGRWDKGLPLLTGGSDPTLKALAQLELAAQNDADKTASLADGWWDVSAREKGAAQTHIKEHAVQLYHLALPKLSGLGKVRADKRISEAKRTPTARTGLVNLLAQVKIERDSVSGEWAYERGVLTVTAAPRARLKIPLKPEKAYALRVEYQRSDGGGGGQDALGVYLPVADTGVVLMVSPPYMGLDVVGGKVWGVNETLKLGHFGGDKKKHLLDIAVWQDKSDARILVQFDGKLQIDWSGPPSALTVYSPSALPAPMSLGLMSLNAPYVISTFALRDYGDVEPPPPAKNKLGK